MAHLTKRRTPRSTPSAQPRLLGTVEEHDRPRSDAEALGGAIVAAQTPFADRQQVEDSTLPGDQRFETETGDSLETIARSRKVHKNDRSREQTVDVRDEDHFEIDREEV